MDMFESKIESIVNRIVEDFKPEKIMLFGSYAWGKPKSDSDVDLFIVKDDTQKNTREMAVDLERILSERNIPIDLLVYKPDQVEKRLNIRDPFITKIFQDGKVLYERK